MVGYNGLYITQVGQSFSDDRIIQTLQMHKDIREYFHFLM